MADYARRGALEEQKKRTQRLAETRSVAGAEFKRLADESRPGAGGPQPARLDAEQIHLLRWMADAARAVPRHERGFLFTRTFGGDVLEGPRGRLDIDHGDVQQLLSGGYVRRTGGNGSDNMQLVVTVEGFEFIDATAWAEPTARLEEAIKLYIDGDDFRRRHPVAYERWAESAELLWGPDALTELTTIGHKTREAVQEFATSLMQQHGISDGPADPRKTVARLRAVIARHGGQLGEARSHLLDALLAYWGEVNDLLQRQEHGGQKEGEPLTWEDGRRAVFHTAIVMYEIDTTL